MNDAIQLAFKYYQEGNLRQAALICEQIIENEPTETTVLHFLGIIYQQLEDYDDAIKYLKTALQLDPNSFQGFYNLGIAFEKKGELNAAIDCYRKVIEINPNFVEAFIRLGNARRSQGGFDEAVDYYRKAIQLAPDLTKAYYNLGRTFQEMEKFDEAMACYQKTVQLDPNLTEAYYYLAMVFEKKGELDKAIDYYQRFIQLNPNLIEAYYNLGILLYIQGRQDESISVYGKAILLSSNNLAFRFLKCIMQLPMIYMDEESIQHYRNRYYEELIKLQDSIHSESPDDIKKAASAVGSLEPFYLAYGGLNDRQLQHIYGNLVCRIMSTRYPQWSQCPSMPPLEPGEPIRVGIVSGYFNYHSVWKIPMKGWVENLDTKRFSLHGYYTGKIKDEITLSARKYFKRFVEDIYPFEEFCKTIRHDNLHVLIYPEVGMDPMTVRLAALRLAPIQCVSMGHPDTTGLPTIDYYLSSDLMEPADADDHYTESLVRLPNLSIYYTPVEFPIADIDRKTLGFGQQSILYLCCQSVSKYLPQYDDIFPSIAKEVGDCRFLFIPRRSKFVIENFRIRINAAFNRFNLDPEKYIFFLPYLDVVTYASVNRLADIFLDSIGWSGHNTTFEAIEYNLPVVTLPGGLMRSRHSSAILTMMGVKETIAATIDEYVELAIKLAKDSDWRRYISEKIKHNKHLVYRDRTCITALEDLLEKLV